MIVIFVGCDCTGKSTYANMMDKSLWEFKKGSANSDALAAITELEHELSENKNVLYDRIPLIDDIVYSQVFSKKDSVLIPLKDKIRDLLSQCCIFYFICETHAIYTRLNERGDEYINADQVDDIKSEYRKAFELLNIHPHIMDTTLRREDKVFGDIMEVINNETRKNSRNSAS